MTWSYRWVVLDTFKIFAVDLLLVFHAIRFFLLPCKQQCSMLRSLSRPSYVKWIYIYICVWTLNIFVGNNRMENILWTCDTFILGNHNLHCKFWEIVKEKLCKQNGKNISINVLKERIHSFKFHHVNYVLRQNVVM